MKRLTPNVLVIDDSQADQETISLYLQDIANVKTVSSGDEAIECVKRFAIDVILLDLEMPGMDGFKTLECLRRQEECINVPVVMVTGVCDRETVLNSVILGIDGYLVKPINKIDLQNKVLEVFDKKSEPVVKRKTILLVDDDMVYLKQVNNMLMDKYNAVMINSPKLALEYLSRHVPDVIILDFQMPAYNGANVMGIIKNNAVGQEVPVIILSGMEKEKVIEECKDYNPMAFLSKPISKKELEATIEQALNQ